MSSNTGRPGAKRCPWIRLDVDLDHHPKVGKLAEAMKCDDERALARLIRFWMGVRVHAPRGDLTDISDATIGQWMRAPSNRAAAWVDALRACGLIVGAEVVGWKERQIGVVEKAERDAKAKKPGARSSRADPARETRDTSADPALEKRYSGSGSDDASNEASCVAAAPHTARRDEAFAWWNGFAAAHGLICADKPTGGKGKRRGPRLEAAAPAILENREALEVELSRPFYAGEGKDGWVASIDYLIQPGKVAELAERGRCVRAQSSAPRSLLDAMIDSAVNSARGGQP